MPKFEYWHCKDNLLIFVPLILTQIGRAEKPSVG
jgi:hypothetical protein